MRNFVTGFLWGTVLSVAGLGVISQMAPTGKAAPPAETPPAPPAEPAKTPADAPEAPAVQPPEPVAAAEPPPAGAAAPQALPEPPAETDEPLLRPMAETDAPPPATVVPDLTLPDAPAQAPQAEAAPEPVKPAEAAPKVADTAPPAALQEPAVAAPAPAPAPAPALPPSESAAPVTESPAPDPETEPAGQAPAATLTPDTGLADKTVDGVTVGRLPAIAPAPAALPPAQPDAEAATDGVAEALADLPPLKRFARSFDNPDGKPLFAILLLDPGTAGVPRADLAALPFPVTFVLDPLAPGAADAATIYRTAGQEVVMLASGIPKGATAADLEQSFAALGAALPEAVAMIDTAAPTFQDDRGLAAHVVTLLAAQGRGLVTFDRGLNAADQVARREGLPATTIFRTLDDAGEETPVIRRYLDRAAFKAAQEGEVAVIGAARPETVAALLEWAVEGRAASVALAPITALMGAK